MLFDGYFNYISQFDYVILISGVLLVIIQIRCLIAHCCGKKWACQDLKIRQQCYLGFSEMFPLLGLFGTILALLRVFIEISIPQSTGQELEISQILGKFAPALTTTASGIISLIANLFINLILLMFCNNKESDKEG